MNAKIFVFLHDPLTGMGIPASSAALSGYVQTSDADGSVIFSGAAINYQEVGGSNPASIGWYYTPLNSAMADGDVVSLVTTVDTGLIGTVHSLAGAHNMGGNFSGLAHDYKNDVLYACTTGNLYTINKLTGAGSSVGSFSTLTSASGLAFNAATDKLYAIQTAAATLFEIDPSDASEVGTDSSMATNIQGLTWSGPENGLWGIQSNGNLWRASGNVPATSGIEQGSMGNTHKAIACHTPTGILFFLGTDDTETLYWDPRTGTAGSMLDTDSYVSDIQAATFDVRRNTFWFGTAANIYVGGFFTGAVVDPVIVYPTENYELQIMGNTFSSATDSLSSLRDAMERATTPIVRDD